MPQLIMNEIVKAAPARTFEAFSDLRNADKMITAIKRIEVLTDGPIGKGTRFKETRTMFGREHTETMEVTDWSPHSRPASYAIVCSSCGTIVESMFRFHPEDSGRATRVEFDLRVKPVSLLAKLMSPLSGLMMKTMRKCIVADIEDMRKVAEQAQEEHR